MELSSGALRQERVGRKRFKTGVEFKKRQLDLTRVIQDRLLDNLPSNYPRDANTNLGEFYRALSEEFARLQISSSDVNEDKYHANTRAEYLFQVLGDSLFLGEKAINEELNDVEYRSFLIRVRNAYYKGSRKDNIEDAVSDIIGLPVSLKEVYIFLRKNKSSYRLVDTHKMFFDIFMETYDSSSPLGNILDELKFFIDLIKPAHVMYDTRLIWAENLSLTGDACTPTYLESPMETIVYNAEKIYIVTYLLSSMYKTEIESGSEGWEPGFISSIDTENQKIITTNNRILVYDTDTSFFIRDAQGDDTSVTINSFNVGDEIRYFSTKDSSSSSNVIDSSWKYNGIIASNSEVLEILTFTNGSKLVYNQNTLVYTRDGNGEYRIDLDDLSINREIAFKGEKFTGTFNFYNVPNEVQDNVYKQFDHDVIKKPYFQENVKKIKELPDGYVEGPQVVVENGIVKVVEKEPKFYERANTKNKVERSIYRYSLFVDDEFEKQFSVTEPNSPLTEKQAFRKFVDFFGYTGIEAPEADYKIEVAITGSLEETTDGATIESINNSTEMCDRKAMCQLINEYEDTRDYHTWPALKLTSGFIISTEDFGTIINIPGTWNVPGAYTISSSLNQYTMPLLPVLDSTGELATASDLIVYVNGKLVEGAIATLDPWSGIITLNFIPPYNTTIRVDYYYADRYPKSTIYFEKAPLNFVPLSDTSGKQNLEAQFTVIGSDAKNSRLTWPFTVDEEYYGDSSDYQVNLFPILSRDGNLAGESDITTYVGKEIASGTVQIIVGSSMTMLINIDSDWSNVSVGDTIVIDATNYLDNTIISTVDYIAGNIITLDRNIALDTSQNYKYVIINYSRVDGAISSVRPLLGHIKLNFLLPAGFYVRFDYYYTHYERRYNFVPDTILGYAPDVIYGSRSGYSFLVDQGITGLYSPIVDDLKVQEIGYRYRAFDLSNTSVLNSSDTLSTNQYGSEGKRASFKNRAHVLNRQNLIFSPEYLNDSDQHIILNDQYLKKNIEATTKLKKGTPIFPKTYTDDGHYRLFSEPLSSIDTYTTGVTGVVDLKAGFEILNTDKAGDIDYNKICDYNLNKKINLYSDLKIESFPDDGLDLPVSTITEGSRTLPIKTTIIEQYYPNREIRINDYLDYVNKVPSELKFGTFKGLKGSNILKSNSYNFLALRRGDTFEIQRTNKLYKYTVIEILDNETVKINIPFNLPSSTYDFELIRDVVINVDTLFVGSDEDQKYGALNRKLVLNNDLGFGYGLPQSVLQNLPGYGVTGASFILDFADPELDPYPRNPNNPSLNFPAGSTLLSSEVITAAGTSIYYPLTGTYAGLTGPSGAVDLGITGPTDAANPFLYTGDKNPVYNVPSGDTGVFISYSEAERRVHWRNWDQELLIVNIGSATGPAEGIIEEDPLNMMDDIGEGIYDAYWKPSTEEIVKYYYYGTAVKTSEEEESNVLKTDYPLGLIHLTREQVLDLEAAGATGMNVTLRATQLGLMDSEYPLNKLIVREILHDNSIKVTEIQEFVAVP